MGEVKTVRVHKGGDIRADHPRDQRYDVCGIDMVRADALDDLRTERDRLEQDAKRYQWLRGFSTERNYMSGLPWVVHVELQHGARLSYSRCTQRRWMLLSTPL
jgi:hypothetical protein